jgi:hypothetical protein
VLIRSNIQAFGKPAALVMFFHSAICFCQLASLLRNRVSGFRPRIKCKGGLAEFATVTIAATERSLALLFSALLRQAEAQILRMFQ